jgi:glycerophosphoryl diester phosphodiesterase
MSRLPLIIGHRGASALAPENTLAAFRRAIEDNADGIEFDVRLAKDGVAVVIHDATLERTGSVRSRVSQTTAAELQKIDVGSWFGSKESSRSFAGEKVPTLQQLFDLYSGNNGLLYLEMKEEPGAGNELVAEVVRMIQLSHLRDRVIVECFKLSLIARVKQIDSTIRTAALFEPKLSRPVSFVRPKLASVAQAHGADEIALHHALASPRAIEKATRLGLRVIVWTVDDPEWVTKALNMGVTGLITNDPARLLARRSPSGV